MKTLEECCAFATYVSENMYELTYQDIDVDGKVWTNLDDENINHDRLSVKRYTIEEIYEKYIS